MRLFPGETEAYEAYEDVRPFCKEPITCQLPNWRQAVTGRLLLLSGDMSLLTFEV